MSKLFGGIMFAIGILIAGASGLCSLVMVGSMFASTSGPDSFAALGSLPIVLLVGGVPFLIGIALCWGGRHLWRMEDKPPQ